MPVAFLRETERARLNGFPDEVAPADLITFFTLSAADTAHLPKRTTSANRLGFALQLCTLRFLGFCPTDLRTIPPAVVHFVADQLRVSPNGLAAYGEREQTRSDHLLDIQRYLGFRRASVADLHELGAWLLARALEHDRPTLLFQMACARLRTAKILRPTVTPLERMVATARQEAQTETFRLLQPQLPKERQTFLDSLLIPDGALGMTPLFWLRARAIANSPKAILATLEKVTWLQRGDVPLWEDSVLTPNRQQFLAQVARRSTNQALHRIGAERRYPLLLAFVQQALVEITDEAMDLFDRCLAETEAWASRDLVEFRATVARATNEKVRLFSELGQVVLDPTVQDPHLRATIYQRISREALQRAVVEAEQIARPDDDNYFDFLEARYSYLRQFVPAFLDAFTFQSNLLADPLLKAVHILHDLNASRRRGVPDDAPMDFIEQKWLPYVITPDGHVDRHYYELCVLWELRNALRAGNVWLASSRRYANPETYLIPKDRWPALRLEVCQQVHLPTESTSRFAEREQELAELFARVDPLLAQDGKVRMEDGNLVISPLEAEARPASVLDLEQRIDERLPFVDLSELLTEVDRWTGFSQCFEHAAGSEPRTKDLQRRLYAALLGQGCNIGLTRMARIADVAYHQLAWCNTWYLREETLQAATTTLVNFQYHQPLSRHWGGGTLSSSDGQRFPVGYVLESL